MAFRLTAARRAHIKRLAEQNRQPLEARFWAKVRKSPGCWEWTGGKTDGYGSIGVGRMRRTDRAHRVAYRLFVGSIPRGLFVCHHCDNPGCVRPSHLFIGTGADNMLDMKRKGRARACRGASNGEARFTWSQIARIRARVANGTPQCRIAREAGVRRQTIGDICAARTYRFPPSLAA